MDSKTRSDFNNQDEWLSHVRENIPMAERPYALACGRTELFRGFYEVRKQTFPVEFALELKRIQALPDPDRTANLGSLNARIFASLTEFLFNQAQSKTEDAEALVPLSPRRQVRRLRDHLTENNPYFAIWMAYKNIAKGTIDAQDWEKCLCEELGSESESDIAFARRMEELDRLLLYFSDKNLSLPKYFFERCWFLHYLRGTERMLQTRSLLNILAAEIEVCASA
jgi:hypothetical protein